MAMGYTFLVRGKLGEEEIKREGGKGTRRERGEKEADRRREASECCSGSANAAVVFSERKEVLV